MQPTVNSTHFLWAAYILVFVAQTAYVSFLAKRAADTKKARLDQ